VKKKVPPIRSLSQREKKRGENALYEGRRKKEREKIRLALGFSETASVLGRRKKKKKRGNL